MAKVKKQKKNKLDKLFEKILNNKQLRLAVVKKDFEWFFPIYFHKRLLYPTAPFQEEMIKLLRDCRKKFLVITAFRGSAKTTITSVAYVLWAVFGIEQKKHILLVGLTEEKARRALANARRHLENNALLRRDLGPIEEEGTDQWGAKAIIIKKLNAKIVAVSVGQSIRGILHDEFRPDLVICDDLESLESVQTQESRDKLSDWFTGELLPVGDRSTRFVIVGNLLHEDSLMRRLQLDIESGERNGEFREYSFFDDDGNPRWPGKYPTPESVDEEKRLIKDPIAWAREYLLKILPRDAQLIRPEWIQRYDMLPSEKPRFTLIGIDPAISKENNADYTAMVAVHVYGHRENMKIYVSPHIVNKRLTFAETVKEAEDMSRIVGMGSRAPMDIEKVAYQQALIEYLKSRGNPVEGISPGGTDKHARLASVTHYFETGKMYFPKGPLGDVLINQHVGFGIEKNDDLVDALTLALHAVMNKERYYGSGGGTWSSPPTEDDLRHLSSRAKFVIMDKWRDYHRPDVITGGRTPMPDGWKPRWDR